jgi:hypothetical protein
MPTKELDDETKKLLKTIVDHFDDEDRGVRDRQIRQWRRLKLLWENIQHTYYSEVAHDWRIPESERSGGDGDQGFYDKPVNIYRAYLESIIAALSVTVPPVTCYPDDADNPLDVSTAKAGDKIATLIFKHNDMPLLWLHALFVFVTEGMTACYTYAKEDEEYGTYEKKQYAEESELHDITTCPYCQSQMSDTPFNPNAPQATGLMPIASPGGMDPNQMDPSMGQDPSMQDPSMMAPPEEDESAEDEFMPEGPQETQQMEQCENCGRMVLPQKSQETFTNTRMVGVTTHPKSRVIMEVYGGLFVKVPVWARDQSDCNYLIYSYETHYANVLEKYPDLREKLVSGKSTYDLYEQWGRTSPQYRGEHPVNNATVRNCWLRPAAFQILNEEECDKLHKEYPDGVKVVVVNDFVADACNEALDDSWTITHNPLSDYIHFDPIGLLLTSVQDITNDLISLVLQTVEHGIPQTFADPKVLNFNAYRQSEVIPGGIYPATPKSGKALSDGFYEVKTATLSQEVLPFSQKIQEIGQMVSGALPSLFGGQMSGSRTASEYSMSRAQALQRLQSTWKMLLMWWKNIHGKAIPLYIKEMKDDEKQVKKDEFGNFVNVFIRRSELEGKIGSVELEANENLPITWNQQKDAIMELFKMNNDTITASLTTPENMPFLKKVIGLDQYIIPGEDDRQKQYEEIQQLINSEPIQMPPDPMMVQEAMQMGQPPPEPTNEPSVQPDYDVDNHVLESDICRRWLVADAGRLCKIENPAGYENVLLHMKMHLDMDKQKQMEQQMEQMQAQMQAQQAQMGMMGPQMGPDGSNNPIAPQSNAGVQMGVGQNAPTVQ